MAATKKTVKVKKKIKKAGKRLAAKRSAAKRPPVRKLKKALKKILKKAIPRSKKRAVARKTIKKAKKTGSRLKTAAKKISTKRPGNASRAVRAVGRVTHFYTEIKVAVVKFSAPVKQGTQVRFKGATTDFSQKLDSMQYDHKSVATAPKGKQVGVKVKSRVREGDQVYL